MEILIYCILDEGTLNHAQERFDGELEARGLTPKEGSPNIWVCGDCFSAADEALQSIGEAATACGVVVQRAFAVADDPAAKTEAGKFSS
ncbi:hypothetical protein OKA05_24955 [Luteolibacter arcticus]|uniref:YCII-related domain-containing protein n=1 Tax=Luteolibacter arcticus TaxID=1581411 RepID=A0ABT3GQP7_9BACT|nr:hypothetical protein [Luteolibacter arcticus]MCW1925832.1 hypothetical protein [Luteolibacter arcticus]